MYAESEEDFLMFKVCKTTKIPSVWALYERFSLHGIEDLDCGVMGYDIPYSLVDFCCVL
jgi:hypothetical protein